MLDNHSHFCKRFYKWFVQKLRNRVVIMELPRQPMRSTRTKQNMQMPNKLVLFYLKLYKAYLLFKRFWLDVELRWKRKRSFYIIRLYFSAPFSWRRRMELLEHRQKYLQVIESCQRRLRRLQASSSRLAELYEIWGRNLRNLNQFDEALQMLLFAKGQLKSKSPSLWYELGLIYFIKKNYPAARHAMEKALQMGYDTVSLRIHLGKIYYQMGMLTRAEECFKRVLRIYPREGSLYFLLGIVYKSNVEYHLAIEAFKNAIKYGSNQKEEHLGLAEIYTRLGYWHEAIQEYKEILRFESNNFIAHYFLGWIYEIQGREDEAIQEYLCANKIDPNDEDTKQKLIRLLASPVIQEEC